MGFFGFGKKAPAPQTAPAVPATVHESTVIYTMPEKFMLPDTPPFWNGRRVWAVVVVVVLALVGVAYWLLVTLPPPAPAPSPAAPAAPPSGTTLPAEPTPPATSQSPEPVPVPVTPPTPPSVEPPLQPEPEAPPPPLPVAADRDQDGLTDIEEVLYGSSADLSDTDADGYPDRDEVLNGYDPAGAGTLAAAGKLVTYRDSAGRFTVAHPATWVAEVPAGQSGSAAAPDVHFVISPDEFVGVVVEPNPQGRALVEWYVEKSGLANPPLLEPVGEHNGLFSADRRTFYFVPAVRPTAVFVVTYHVGAKSERSYPTAFEAFLRSLQPLVAAP